MPKGATAGPGLEPGTSGTEVRGSNRSAMTAPSWGETIHAIFISEYFGSLFLGGSHLPAVPVRPLTCLVGSPSCCGRRASAAACRS